MEFEKDYILRALAASQGNMSRTAEMLGVERSNLYKKMKAFGIAPGATTPSTARSGSFLAQPVFQHLLAREAFELQ